MLLRYDFLEKLDLSRFKIQVLHYIKTQKKLILHIFVKDFSLLAYIEDNIITLQLIDLTRDHDNDIISSSYIDLLSDIRFKNFNFINLIVDNKVSCSSEEEVLCYICNFLNLLFKLSDLLIFL